MRWRVKYTLIVELAFVCVLALLLWTDPDRSGRGMVVASALSAMASLLITFILAPRALKKFGRAVGVCDLC